MFSMAVLVSIIGSNTISFLVGGLLIGAGRTRTCRRGIGPLETRCRAGGYLL